MSDATSPTALIWRQLGGAVDMLGRAMEACPDDLWARDLDELAFWFQAYHALFYLDHDLHDAGTPFASAPFDVHEYEARVVPPPFAEAYAKADLLAYRARAAEQARAVLADIGAGRDLRLLGCDRLEAEPLEVVLIQLRHVQHHASQLNAMLRREGVEPPRWVRRAASPVDA